MRLLTPDVVEDTLIDILRRRHIEHLAALERDRGLNPRTIEPLKTIDRLAGSGVRLREDKPPVLLLGLFGTSSVTRSRSRNTPASQPVLDMDWELHMQLVVVGVDRRDTIKRRGWYAMTIIECLLQRVPLDQDVIDQIVFTGQDFSNGIETGTSARTVGEAQLTFTVTTKAAVGFRYLPPDDTTLTPGTPGAAPAASYDDPVPWPEASPVGPADVDLA